MKLRSIRYAQPEWRVTSEEVASWCAADAAFIRNKIGIDSRAFLRPQESAIDLAAEACEQLFEEQHLAPDAIELLVFVTQNPDLQLPHSGALVQDRLGLPVTCATFDLGLGCSGWVYGLSVAKALMFAQGMENALLVTCDPYSRVIDRMDKNTVTVFGDAAAATWLSSERGAELGLADFGTDGSGAPNLIAHHSGGVASRGMTRPADSSPAQPPTLHMNGREVFNFMMTRVPESVARCLRRNALEMHDIDLFVFHQANRYLLESVRTKLRIPPERFVVEVAEVGNTVSSSIPIALRNLGQRSDLAGKKVVVCGFGVGLSWATNVIQYNGKAI